MRAVIVTALFISASSLGGEQATIQDLLPSESEASPWTLAHDPLTYTAETLFNFINGGAEVYLEYGFVRVVSQEYMQGENSIIVTLYEMKDPEAAFGVFSYHRTPQKNSLSLGDGGFGGGNQLSFWQGRYFVVVETFSSSEAREQVLRSLAGHVSKKIDEHAEEPAVLQKLPREGLIPGSEKLLRGRLAVRSLFFLVEADLFELGKDNRVLYGEYEQSLGTAKLFIVTYQDGAASRHVYTRLKDALTAERGYRSLEQEASQSLWSRGEQFIGLSMDDNAPLVLVANAASLELARELTR